MGRKSTVVRTPKFRQRARVVRAERRSKRRKIVITLVLLSAMSGGGWALAHSRVFGISRIDVAGAPAAERAHVLRASGLRVGQSAIGADLTAATAHVRALPWVAAARIEHVGALALRIVIRTRSAEAIVESAGRRWYVDRSGASVGAPADGTTVPVVALPDERSLAEAGWSLDAAITSALSLWDRFPADVRERVRSIAPRASGEFEFQLGATKVRFGRLTQLEEKFSALSLVEARVRSEHRTLRSIDVAAPEHPAARIA